MADDWRAVEDAVRASDFVGAQRALDKVKDAIGPDKVIPVFGNGMQAYVDQAQAVLDKVGQRAQGQFEIPGVAPASPLPHIEDAAPELNAAFDDVLQNSPEANQRLKRLADELGGLRDQIRNFGGDLGLETQIQDAIDKLNRQDYQGAFVALDGVFNQPHGDTPSASWVTAPDRFSQYADFKIANDAFQGVWDDWTAMLDGNPDLQKYVPSNKPDSQEPLRPGEQNLPGEGGPKSDVPGPYDPKARADAIVSKPPKGGVEIKDEQRIIERRRRGEIQEAVRGVGGIEVPDRYALDRNGVLVHPLDIVDVPAAGNQGPQGTGVHRRPAGVGQVRLIREPDKNGVVYVDVAFYDPAFVDFSNENKAKADGGLLNQDVFRKWTKIRLDKIQKLDPENPAAQEFIGHLGPEEARRYAGRNAGRLAQNRGRVKPELERMANLQYIGDRYAADANGLPVGEGDVVIYNGKKYEVKRVNVDAGRNTRIKIAPVGVDAVKELQAGGEEPEPYARQVQFYDKPLGDNAPAVTVDELKDLVRRLDAGGEYIVGDDLRAALEENDLKQITKAMGSDDAILNYVADGRAYIQNYVDRLLKANLVGNYDEVKRNEPQMVRKDKNDLLNAVAAQEGRFLEGTGESRHIVREIPLPGPDPEYKGQRPEVLMPLRYVQMKDVAAKAVADDPADPLLPEAQTAMARAGAINLDDPLDFNRARAEFVAIGNIAGRNGHPEIQQAALALIVQMNRWREDQDKRKAIRQGGPGAEANLPGGRTVAPGLIKEPGISNAPAAPGVPDNRAEIDRTNPVRDIAQFLERDPLLDANGREEADALRRAGQAWADGSAPTPADRKLLRAYLVERAMYEDDGNLRSRINDWVDYLDRGTAPAAPAAPAAPNANDGEYAARMLNDTHVRDRYAEVNRKLNDAYAAVLGDAPDLAAYLDEAYRALKAGRYGEGFHAIENVLGVPEEHPNADVLKGWQEKLVSAGAYFDLNQALIAAKHDWPERFFPETPDLAPAAPGAPAGPVVKNAGDLQVGDVWAIEDFGDIGAAHPGPGHWQVERIEPLGTANRYILKRVDKPGAAEVVLRPNLQVKVQNGASAAPAAPQNPEDIKKAIADAVEARFEELVADRKNNAARKQAIEVQDAGDYIDTNIQSALDANADENEIDVRDKYMGRVARRVEMLRADNPELAAALDQHIKNMRDAFALNDQSRLIDKYLAEADRLHNLDTPDNDRRDRMINAAQDQINKIRSVNPALADSMQSKLDGMKAQYAVDDKERARAKPIGRTEAIDNFDAGVMAERKRLRDAGKADEARALFEDAANINDAINSAEEAHKKGDKAERDAKLDEARAAIPDLEARNPDLAEEARKAVEGNAARFAREDSPRSAISGSALDDLGDIPDARTDITLPNSKTPGDMADVANLLRGFTRNDIYQIVRGRKPAPAGLKFETMDGGSIGAATKVTHIASKKHYVVKSDKISPLGLEAEEDTSILYQALGLNSPDVYRLRAKNDGDDIIIMGWAQQQYKQAKHVKRFAEAFPQYRYGGSPDLSELNLADPLDAARYMLANAVLGQTDRHPYNEFYGVDKNGNGVIICIDNGLMWWNGSVRSAAYDETRDGRENSKAPWLATPLALMLNQANGNQHNENQFARAGREVLNGMSDQEAKSFITTWAKRMIQEAQARGTQFRNPGAADWVRIRGQWMIDNVDDIVPALRSGQIPRHLKHTPPPSSSW
jgi:hypothetical protein